MSLATTGKFLETVQVHCSYLTEMIYIHIMSLGWRCADGVVEFQSVIANRHSGPYNQRRRRQPINNYCTYLLSNFSEGPVQTIRDSIQLIMTHRYY